MKKRILKLSFFIFSCVILSNLFIKVNVNADNLAQEDTNASGPCTAKGCWPYLNGGKVVQALRFTVYDGDSRTKVSLNSVDLVNNETHYNNINGKTLTILGKDGKPSYLKGSKNLEYSDYDGTVENLHYVAGFPDWYGGNKGDIKSWWNGLSIDTKKEILGWAGYTRYSAQDVIVVEPVTVLQWGGKSYWGSAYEFVKYQYDIAKCTLESCSNAVGVARRIMAASIHLSTNDPTDDYGFITDVGGTGILWRLAPSYVETSTFTASDGTSYEHFKNVDNATAADYIKGNYGYGIGAFWIKDSGLAKSCNIDINNNTGDDKKYNWTYWDGSCDADGDGVKEGCWKKQPDGCCEQVTLTAEILNKYPQCAPCTPNNKTYVNGQEITGLNSVSCDNNDKAIINYRGTGNLNKTTPKYCLANNNLLVGIINGKRYGCEITDKLLLPKKYGDDLSIGQYFVWPTSKTLQKLGNFDLRYPLTRTSNVTCVAYKYNSVGQLEYENLTKEELAVVKDRFKTSGNLNLTFNGDNNGNIIEESQKSNFENTGNNLFTGNISTVYTLEEVKGTNGVYAYYDQEKLEYTKTIISSRINKYIQYGFPIIPFGNHKDTNVSITYGINFDKIDLSRLKSYSGSYVCSKKKNNNNITGGFCKCEPGTLYEGLDLTPYFKNNYDSWLAECSRVRDLKCNDANTPIKCPNDDTIDMTNCVKNNVTKGYTYSRAYELCVASDCNCIGSNCLPKRCQDQDNNCDLDIIYRPIFLNNPFPSIKGNKRGAGANWGGNNSLNSDGLGTKYITSTASKMYQGQAMYTFTLTPKAIKEIKNYNKAHKYDDFELSCGENQYCTSDVLRGSFSEYFTGGTCQLQTNAKIRGSNDCRLTALNQ